jgi:hypothetical protein
MSVASSPFRRDGSVERRVTCAPADVALRVITRDANPGPALLAYLAALAAGAALSAALLPNAATAGVSCALLLLSAAALLRRTQRQRATLTDAQRATLPVRCAFTADALILEGSHGESAWRYGSVRRITAHGEWLLVVLHGNLDLVLRADEPGDEPLHDFLARRATGLDPRDPRRALWVLGLLYAALVALSVVAARATARPPEGHAVAGPP